ncbi:helix-turn-helix domain-containing protein [Nonomuraea sp. 10N515B]|uniref:helix-turn-helix domain-containing protein n=1 Tax=Nonomuraea sp. 10N515B TaxID=3457422 RepID=UPI003FCD7D3D
MLGSELRHWRDEVCGLSQREAAAQALCDHGDLSRWERGQAQVLPDVIERLDALYGAQGRLKALRAFAGEFDRLRQVVPEEASDLAEDDDMHRRAAMRLLAALGAGVAIPPGTLETLFSGIDNAVADRGIHADDWEEIAWEHGFSYYTQAPGTLIHAVAADLAEVSRLLQRTSSAVARTGLLRVSAQLAVLMGMEMSDVGELRSSRQSWQVARRAADATGDRELRVWVRGWEAEYGFWAGRPAPVLARLTEDAVHIAQGAASAGLAEALRARAFVAASQGDVHTVRVALGELRDVYERLPGDATSERTTPLWSFAERDAAWANAYSLALIGDTTPATAAVDRAIAVCPPTFTGNINHYELVRALALVGEGDIDHGLGHAVTTAHAWPISTIRCRTLGRILDALPKKGRELEAARELRSLAARPAADA